MESTMLVLTRKEQEAIMIGDSIVVRVLEVRGDQVRLGGQRDELLGARPDGVGCSLRVGADPAGNHRHPDALGLVGLLQPEQIVIERGGGRDVEHVRVPSQDREVVDPSTHSGRPDVAKAEFVEGTLRGERRSRPDDERRREHEVPRRDSRQRRTKHRKLRE